MLLSHATFFGKVRKVFWRLFMKTARLSEISRARPCGAVLLRNTTRRLGCAFGAMTLFCLTPFTESLAGYYIDCAALWLFRVVQAGPFCLRFLLETPQLLHMCLP
jgi:hypothetical protein